MPILKEVEIFFCLLKALRPILLPEIFVLCSLFHSHHCKFKCRMQLSKFRLVELTKALEVSIFEVPCHYGGAHLVVS